MNSTTFGRTGEKLAEKRLKRRGWRIIAANYLAAGGELDLVGYRFGTLAYFEVKTRSGDDYGRPADAVDARKLARMQSAAASLKATYYERGRIPVFYPFGLVLRRRVRREATIIVEVYLSRSGVLRRMNFIKLPSGGYEK